MAAIFARESSERPVVVVESTADGGRKILISGGGRCNVLPAALEPERFVSDSSPALLRRMLKSWPLDEQRAFFEQEVGVRLVFEPETRKWFPASHRARDIRDGLVDLARRRGATFEFKTRLQRLEPHDAGVRVGTSAGEHDAAAVILATGGLSVPTTGSDGVGLQVVRDLGVTVNEIYPALTPLVASEAPHASLAGVSFDVRLRARWRDKVTETRGGFLFTHHGYSGPSVLDISHVPVRSRLAGDTAPVRVQWCETSADEWRQQLTDAPGLVLTAIARRVPERLVRHLMQEAGVPLDRRTAELRRTERAVLVELLTAYQLPWTGDEGYRKAEVTGGGVALDEVDSRTLQSRRYPGVFICGELLDAFGPIGGHNFAWAWATGRLAGLGTNGTRQ